MAESIREKSQMMKDARCKVGRMLFSKNGQMVFGDMWFTDICLRKLQKIECTAYWTSC